jgi:hypothetical protein
MDSSAQAVLGCVENVLVRVKEARRLGHSQNCPELASGGSFVLGVGLESQTTQLVPTQKPSLFSRLIARESRKLIWKYDFRSSGSNVRAVMASVAVLSRPQEYA